MEQNIYAPLSEGYAKTLGDKMHDRRKMASQEIERIVVDYNNAKNTKQIQKLLGVLEREFVMSRDTNKKKGGLLALASVSIGLGKDTETYINALVHPILNCLQDADPKIRYAAIESLYNVVKVARSSIVPLFPDVFVALSRLAADNDAQLRTGSEMLDKLLKDILTESSQTFELDAFIPLIRERIYSKNSFSRQFIISWISILNVVPEINMVIYLPEIIDGLFQMLDDNMMEIHRTVETVLNQFLKNIRNDSNSADIPAVTNNLIGHAQSGNELIQLTAISWISEFVQLSGSRMLRFTSGILMAILPCLAYDGESKKPIKECAQLVNKNMFQLVTSKNENVQNLKSLDLDSVMEVLRQYLSNSPVNTKIAVLKWIHHLFTQIHSEMSGHAASLFPVLLGVLSDSSDEVVLQGLEVLAEIVQSSDRENTTNREQYRKFLVNLLERFSKEKSFLENKGSLIIRQLCVLLNAELIYRTFAEIILEETTNFKFASTMVRTLNIILLTSSELFELRSLLRNIEDPKSASLFECLYKCWSHCPVSTLSLCLLSQCYQHVSQLVVLFGNLEITMEFLVEIDKLVQLIESPIFASLRLTLISHRNGNADAHNLSQALFGILMLLPQTEAFHLLKNRLQCIPSYWDQSMVLPLGNSIESKSKIDFNELLVHFQKMQAVHQQQRVNQMKRAIRGEMTQFSDVAK